MADLDDCTIAGTELAELVADIATELDRVDGEDQDQDLVIFGRHPADLQRDTECCTWVMPTVDAGESSAVLLRLAHYIQVNPLDL